MLNVEYEELKEFFSGCILPGDIKKIEGKLIETISIRREMFQSSGEQIPKIFDFYWIDPQMVIFFPFGNYLSLAF